MAWLTESFDRVQRDRLVNTFLELAAINGPSGNETLVAEFLDRRLRALGFSIEMDDAHQRTGGECGNLIAWREGTEADLEPVFLSAHMDTVLPTAGLHPLVENGEIRSDGSTILGADDRAAIAAYLEALTVIEESEVRCAPLQLIFTVSEQPGLLGSRHLDYSHVRAKRGYIYDSSGDVGQLIVKGPFSDRVRFQISGRKAHLGLAPEEGVNAIAIAADAVSHMRLGRVDSETVANIGVIHGGELPSIIPDEVEMIGEARSFSREGLASQVDHMRAEGVAAAQRHGGRVETTVERKYLGWELLADSDHVQAALRAATRVGLQPYFAETLGGADTNVFMEHGLTCMTLGNGFRKIHSFEEHISVENLVATARHLVALLEEVSCRG